MNFYKPKANKKGVIHEVSVRVNKDNGTVAIIKEFADNITKGEYVTFAIEGTRMYLKEADVHTGLKLKKPDSSSRRRRLCLSTRIKDVLVPGYYNLLFDKENGLYYIDFSKGLK